jgi:hypothetical protein
MNVVIFHAKDGHFSSNEIIVFKGNVPRDKYLF